MSTARSRMLLPYQARWYQARGPWRVAAKSRQIGLTWSEAGRQAMIAATERASGGRSCLYVSTSLLLAGEFIDTVATWAAALEGTATDIGLTVIRDGANDILAHEVRFASGHKVVGVSSNPAAFRGRRGEVAIDEGAHHLRLDEILKAAFAVTRWGGEVAVISTHNGAGNRFNKLCKEVRSGALRGSFTEVTIHQAIADGLFRRLSQVNGRPWSREAEAQFLADCLASPGAAEEFECIVSQAGTQFYREDLLAKTARPAIILHLQRDHAWLTRSPDDRKADTKAWCDLHLRPALKSLAFDKRHYLGKDFARRVDLSAVVVLEQEHDLTLGTPIAIELRNVPDDEQEQISEYLLAHIPLCTGYAMDVTEGGGRNEAERLGARWGSRDLMEGALIAPVRLSSSWYDREHHRLRARLEERDLWIPRDEDIFEDLQSWRVAEKTNRLELGPRTTSKRDQLLRHGDIGVAILLAQSLAPDVPQGPKYRELQPATPRRAPTRGGGRYGL